MKFTYFEIQVRQKGQPEEAWQTVPVGHHVRPRPQMACAGFEERRAAQKKLEELSAAPDVGDRTYRIMEVVLDIRVFASDPVKAPAQTVHGHVARAIRAAMERRELLRYEVTVSNDCVYVGGRVVYTADGLHQGLVRPMLDVEEHLKAVIIRAVAEHEAQLSAAVSDGPEPKRS